MFCVTDIRMYMRMHQVRCIPMPSPLFGGDIGCPLLGGPLLGVHYIIHVNEMNCHSSGIPRKDCNIVNSTIYLTTTLFCKKSLISSIQI